MRESNLPKAIKGAHGRGDIQTKYFLTAVKQAGWKLTFQKAPSHTIIGLDRMQIANVWSQTCPSPTTNPQSQCNQCGHNAPCVLEGLAHYLPLAGSWKRCWWHFLKLKLQHITGFHFWTVPTYINILICVLKRCLKIAHKASLTLELLGAASSPQGLPLSRLS